MPRIVSRLEIITDGGEVQWNAARIQELYQAWGLTPSGHGLYLRQPSIVLIEELDGGQIRVSVYSDQKQPNATRKNICDATRAKRGEKDGWDTYDIPVDRVHRFTLRLYCAK